MKRICIILQVLFFLPNSSIILIISFWHSFGCFFAYTPSGIMYIGYIMAAFPSKLAFIFAVQRLSIKLTNQIRLPRSSRQPFLTIGHFPKATIFRIDSECNRHSIFIHFMSRKMINPGNYVKLLVTGFFDAERKAAKNQKMFTAAAARQNPITKITSESRWSLNKQNIKIKPAEDK